MREDERLIDKDLVLDLHVLGNHRHTLDADPLPEYALPTYYRISDEGMCLNESLAHNAGVREPDTSRHYAILSDNNIWADHR